MTQKTKTILVWLAGILIIFGLVHYFNTSQSATQVSYAKFVTQIDEDASIFEKTTLAVNVHGSHVVVDYKLDGKPYTVTGPATDELYSKLDAKRIDYKVEPKSDSGILPLLLLWIPTVVVVVLVLMIMRQMQSGGGKAMSFGKSKARLLTEHHGKITFKDVAGIDEAREEVEEIIDFLRDTRKYMRVGGRIPKGVLLMGPPGTGKTLLARAIAGEAGVSFLSISGSDFVEMFVGVGASRVRDLFEQGKKNAPCIIFIDEIDAVGRHRGAGFGGGHDEREQTLNQLLVEMDGFESNEGVILVAATNRPDVLDPALLRRGRFDRRIIVGLPDVRGREMILSVHTKKVPLDERVNLSHVARGTPGFSGADLENLVNEAALLAAKDNRDRVTGRDLENAKDKVLMGAERKSVMISEEEKRTTAWHEAGHTLVAMMLPAEHVDPIHKVTIIPRGQALGVTQQLPEQDRHNLERRYAEAKIAILMAGRIAEELALDGQQTTGAGNDIETATSLARKMVCEWGMSDAMGPIAYGKNDSEPFLGRDIQRPQNYSEATAQEIDREVRTIIMQQYERAKQILVDHGDALKRLAAALIERESLGAEEVKAAVEGRPLPAIEDDGPAVRPRLAPGATPQVESTVGARFPVAEAST